MTEQKKDSLQFPLVLASLAHDMKNSLGMLINTTEEILENCTAEACSSFPLLSRLQYEAKRVNNNLIQLLTLYKMDRVHYTVNISSLSVAEFLGDMVTENMLLLRYKGISIVSDCNEGLIWFFDRDLISGVINNVLNNAYRYAHDTIRLSAAEEDGYLAIHIRDDGEGYPEHMLTGHSEEPAGVSFSTGSTGLGLYFASTAAKLHTNKGREGFIRTSNCTVEGGGCFSIYLP